MTYSELILRRLKKLFPPDTRTAAEVMQDIRQRLDLGHEQPSHVAPVGIRLHVPE